MQAALSDCSGKSGVYALFEAERIPPVVLEMIRDQCSDGALSFMLVHETRDDVSDKLISPYSELGMKRALSGTKSILEWANCLSKSDDVKRVEIFLTEGFSEEFECIFPKNESLEETVISRLEREDCIPSIRISIPNA